MRTRKIEAAAALFAALSLVSTVAVATTCPVNPAQPSGKQQWCGCPTSAVGQSAANAIDLSHRVTTSVLKSAKESGIKTVFRYYDWDYKPGAYVQLDQKWELMPGSCKRGEPCEKTVDAEEIAAIHNAGLSVGIVFQHRMSETATWRDTRRADYDADRALSLAADLKQPKRTTIYFGVDGADQHFHEEGDKTFGRARIVDYFRTIKRKIEAAGYDVGVYGSGLACEMTVDSPEKLARYCWLSISTGHTNSQNREAKGDWAVKQCATRNRYQGTTSDVDPDIARDEFGQWRPK